MGNGKTDMVVRAGRDNYPLIFGDFRRRLAGLLTGAAQVVIISNGTVYALHGRSFEKNFIPSSLISTSIMIGDGERYKTQRTVSLIHDHLFDIGLQRNDAIIAFGGGVVGDVAGFAASTFKRGVLLIHVPTTLLSMVDSSIGGKTGLNHTRGKNLIGTFYQPKGVVVNPEWLATLGKREMIQGLAEIIKAGYLSSRRLLDEAVRSNLIYDKATQGQFNSIIKSAAAFKAKVVAGDVFDQSSRAVLNFGHTFAHAIEKAEGYGRYRHGEAVLAGMVGALYLSHLNMSLSAENLRQYLQYLKPFIPFLRPLKKHAGHYVAPMAVDKKGRGGKRIFVLLERIGRPVIREIRSEARIKESIEFMKIFVNSGGEM